ncbi:hypothetical protein ACJIZ3_001330 [Penstemon smallii]|uniref:Cyclin-dependent kinase inhibitor domain-containing protein n=1 Tax=Penstemon smallii TaxID=265156 RepID=A0ABD3U4E1_9LAMI
MQLISSKKRKLYLKLENEYCKVDVELPEKSLSPAVSGRSMYDVESSDIAAEKSFKSPDLESEGFETEISVSTNGYSSREATQFCIDSNKQGLMDSSSTSKKKSSPPPGPCRKIPVEKMPSVAELEEFFEAAEKYEQKRFAEKYNYDIAKDVPLEGKFQWVRLRF